MMVAAVLAVVASGCIGSGDDPTVGSSPSPTIILADCPVEPAEPPTDWPLALPSALLVSDYVVNGNAFLARGITNDPERLLIEVTEETLADFTSSEPDGGANDVVIVFESPNATGSLFMNDPDENDCWDVDLEIDFLTEPEPSEFVQSDGDDAGGIGDGAEDPNGGSGLAEPSGSANITTARGTFPLLVETCQLQPMGITATAAEGDLVITQSASGETLLTWTYTDGVTISDGAANPVVSSSDTALVVGNGQNADGPETVIVDVTCDG